MKRQHDRGTWEELAGLAWADYSSVTFNGSHRVSCAYGHIASSDGFKAQGSFFHECTGGEADSVSWPSVQREANTRARISDTCTPFEAIFTETHL